jgi:ubiquinone/menaquinone biosynthesis C-methylase UbiE
VGERGMLKLRKTEPGEPLAVAMPGVKLGDRLLVLGGGDPPLIARLAAKAGLTGRACVLDESHEKTARAAAAVERDGVLIESFSAPWSALPFDTASFDVVVIRDVLRALDPEPRVRCVQEAWRVLRDGGRCVVIERGTRGGLGALLGGRGNEPYTASGGAARALEADGFVAVRTLAEREGLAFVEGVKPNKT